MNIKFLHCILCVLITGGGCLNHISEDDIINSDGDCGCSGDKLSRNGEVNDHEGGLNDLVDRTYKVKSETLLHLNHKMVFIDGGVGVVGTDKPIMKGDGESPKRNVKLSSFYLDKYEVSNDGIYTKYFQIMYHNLL